MAEITFRLQSEEINKEVLQQLVGVAEAFNTSVFRLLENDEAKALLVKRILELSAQNAITIDPYPLLSIHINCLISIGTPETLLSNRSAFS